MRWRAPGPHSTTTTTPYAPASASISDSHEPASILQELVFRDNYEAMQFLIDRGIDMTILDHRWNATVEGWARYGAHSPKMGDWLAEAQRRREKAR